MKSFAYHTWRILLNDLRLTRRELRANRTRTVVTLGLGLALFLAVQGGSLLLFLNMPGPPPLALQGGVWLFLASVMLGIAVHQTISLMYVRSDIDLLLSSPVSPRSILLARLLAIAVVAGGSVALFLFPLINAAAFAFGPRYMFGYPATAFVAILASAGGLVTALLLVRCLGPRRGRVIAQVTGALLGASVYLLTQAPHWLPPHRRAQLGAVLDELARSPIASLPARAARGELPMLAVLGLASLAGAAIAARALDRSLLRGAQAAVEKPSRRASLRPPARWQAGPLRVAVKKDVRLIVRDPMLLTQVLPSVIYILPAALALISRLGWSVMAVTAVLVAGQFAGLLTRVAADGEECWDLIRMSPAPELRQRFAKLLAGMVVPVAVATLLCSGVALAGRPWLALVGWSTSIVVSAGCARIQIATIRPTPRTDLMKRPKGSFSPTQIVAGGIILFGTSGVAFAASGWTLLASCVLGTTMLVVVICFGLVRFTETKFTT